MTKLNLDKSIDRLTKKLNSLYPDENNNGPGYWKGRKIIPKDQWLRMAHSISKKNKKYSVRDALQYFPDSYIEYVFPFGVPEHLKAEADKWYTYYIELMQHKKDPGYGSTKCHECLLCPQRDKFVLYIGIHKVIARGLEPEKKEGEEYTPIYPCPIINRYECPYEREGRPNVNDLFEIQEIAHAVDMAFLKAYTITKTIRKRIEKMTRNRVLEFSINVNPSAMRGQIIFFLSVTAEKQFYPRLLERILDELQDNIILSFNLANQVNAIGLNLAIDDVFKIEEIRAPIESFDGVQEANVFFPIKLECPQEWVIRLIDHKLKGDTATGRYAEITVSETR